MRRPTPLTRFRDASPVRTQKRESNPKTHMRLDRIRHFAERPWRNRAAQNRYRPVANDGRSRVRVHVDAGSGVERAL